MKPEVVPFSVRSVLQRKSLQEEGLIKRVEEGLQDRKKKYAITAKGREEFMTWLKEPTNYQPARSEFLLKLSFSKDLKQEEIKRMILSYQEDHRKKLIDYGKMEEYMKQNQETFEKDQRFFIHAPLRYGTMSAESVVSWCDEMLKEMDMQN